MGRLGPIESDLDAPAPGEEERFSVCDVCGQIFDLHDDTQLRHHGSDEHEALTSES